MNTRRLTIIGIAVVTLALGATFMWPQTPRRSCGDPHDFLSLLSKITGLRLGPTHCCYAGSMIADLRTIWGAMESYRIENGAYPTSFDAITNYIMDPWSRLAYYRLQSDGKHWTITVPQHPGLPGHYLLIGEEEHLYFNVAKPAMTNDLDLFKGR